MSDRWLYKRVTVLCEATTSLYALTYLLCCLRVISGESYETYEEARFAKRNPIPKQ